MALIFLTSMPRAGSTWISNVIGRTSSVNYVSGEPFNPPFSRVGFGLEVDEWFVKMEPRMIRLTQQLDNAFCQKWHIADFNRRLNFVMPQIVNLKLFLRIVKHYYFFLNRKQVFLKDPIGFFSTEFIYHRYHAQIIILVRHPGGIISSFLRLDWDIDTSIFQKESLVDDEVRAKYVDLLVKKYSRRNLNRIEKIEKLALIWNIFYLQSYLWSQKYLDWKLIRHEDISADPLASMKTLFHNLGLEFSNTVATYLASTSNSENPIDAKESVIHDLNRNSLRNINSWRKNFNEDEVATIEAITSDVRRLFKY